MITLEQMLLENVHLGHPVQKWNPRMSSFIYGERNGIHIIDLIQTLLFLEKVSLILKLYSKQNKISVFLIINFLKNLYKLLFFIKLDILRYTFCWNQTSFKKCS